MGADRRENIVTRFLHAVHDAWCGITGRCNDPEPPPLPVDLTELGEDEFVTWMQAEANASLGRMRQQQPRSDVLKSLTGDFADDLLTGGE